ncbi:cellobiose phosphorylase [Legionella norrlandica]|uniref:Cellobiose phosphorylase n=1 Tax=Legionella norrlandica TaxID=1498499 RepID=A0A0A2SQC5_9GAMM|nr:ChbG/HpnK family deacetylase [Legionella norrlandica]KGP63340.1 cellobiose phosphorylase [Legionella norrlandica]
MSVLKNVFLCADDFGLNNGITLGILKLARLQRLSAVSCIVNAKAFHTHAKELLSLKSQLQTGLHFNLTEGHLLSTSNKLCFGLKELLMKSQLRILNTKLISDEFHAQLDHYVAVMGELPDFIDGHQHIHQFPVIRQIILDIYQQKLKGKGIAIRSTYPSIRIASYQSKSKILAITGGKTFSSQLKKMKIPHNPYFGGIYDFSERADYRSLFRQWLQEAPNNSLIMCHPGEDDLSCDAIAAARTKELDYFSSEGFIKDCQKYQVHLATGPKS